VSYYRDRGQLVEIDGEQSVDEVAAKALSAIENVNRL
jgi:adenylate kinase family enzyme